jgi:hypothetical protein
MKSGLGSLEMDLRKSDFLITHVHDDHFGYRFRNWPQKAAASTSIGLSGQGRAGFEISVDACSH